MTDPRYLGKLTHGHCRNGRVSRTYMAWVNMKDRCEDPGDDRYHRYGGRGITYCNRWKAFENFLADMGEPEPGMSLDRIDVNGNYEPANCRWASRKAQQRNMSTNRLLTFLGRTQCVAAWAEETGIKARLISQRLSRRWSVSRALSTR